MVRYKMPFCGLCPTPIRWSDPSEQLCLRCELVQRDNCKNGARRRQWYGRGGSTGSKTPNCVLRERELAGTGGGSESTTGAPSYVWTLDTCCIDGSQPSPDNRTWKNGNCFVSKIWIWKMQRGQVERTRVGTGNGWLRSTQRAAGIQNWYRQTSVSVQPTSVLIRDCHCGRKFERIEILSAEYRFCQFSVFVLRLISRPTRNSNQFSWRKCRFVAVLVRETSRGRTDFM